MSTAADLEGEDLLSQLGGLQRRSGESSSRQAVCAADPGFWKAFGTVCHHVCSAYSFRLVRLRPVSEGRYSEEHQLMGLGRGWGRHRSIRCCCLLGCLSSSFVSRWNELCSGVIFFLFDPGRVDNTT